MGKTRPPEKSKARVVRDKAYQIVRPAQLRALVSPMRGEVYEQVYAFGPISVKEVAALMGVAPASLYYHIEHLIRVGLLIEAGERATGKRPEQLYDVPARPMRMLSALQEPRNEKIFKALSASLCRQANKDFARGFAASHRKTSGRARNVRLARLLCRPDAATLAQVNAHFDAISDLIEASADGVGERVSFTWVVSPQRRKAGGP